MSKIPDPNKMKRIKGPFLSRKQLQSAKIRITLDLDPDILEGLRKLATQSHKNYQTLLNHIIRQFLSKKAA